MIDLYADNTAKKSIQNFHAYVYNYFLDLDF